MSGCGLLTIGPMRIVRGGRSGRWLGMNQIVGFARLEGVIIECLRGDRGGLGWSESLSRRW